MIFSSVTEVWQIKLQYLPSRAIKGYRAGAASLLRAVLQRGNESNKSTAFRG